MLEQGKTEKTIIAAAKASRQPLPDKIQNAPQLLMGLDLFYNAFWDLHTCRSIGMAEGLIPWTAIKQYVDEKDFIGEVREDFFYHIPVMDAKYLEHAGKKHSKDIKNGNNS